MSLLISLLVRFRWPLMSGIAMCVSLWFFLQPRPVAVNRIHIGEAIFDEFIISPSGSYMVHFAILHGNPIFKLLNLTTNELILQEKCQSKRLCRFDKDDGLAYVLNNNMYYLASGASKPQATGSCSVTTPSIHFDISRLSLYDTGPFSYEDNSLSSNFLLSPDAGTWLVPRILDDQWQFCLHDVSTGSLRATLDKQFPSEIGRTSQFAFSRDSRLLLIQTVIHNDAPPQPLQAVVDLFDCCSGKKLKSITFPEGVKIDYLVTFDESQITSLEERDDFHFLQLISDHAGYRKILLKETVSEPFEQHWPKPGDGIWKAQSKLNERIHATDNQLLYCWERHLLPKTGGLGGGSPYLPGTFYSVRELKTGGLLHTDRLPLRHRKNQDWDPEGWDTVALLPGSSMLLRRPHQELPDWQQQLESWRLRFANWIPVLFSQQARLHCIEATIGTTSAILSQPSAFQLYSFFEPHQKALYLTYEMDGVVHLQKYAFPFQKPWILIVSWSLAALVGLACLQILVQLVKRQKKQSPRSSA